MTPDLPNCRATGIGSTPHTDPVTAVNFVLETFPHIPYWPQLPRRTFRENMYVQYSEHMPGVLIDDEKERIRVDLGDDWLNQAEGFYAMFLEEDPTPFGPSSAYAAGLYELLARDSPENAWAVKGQVTGPISFGLQVTDTNLRPSLYDDMMRDTIIKNALRHAQWQEAQLKKLHPRVLVFVDEPFLSLFGSAYAAISREDVIAALEEVFTGLECWTGTHCCANTDWSLLLTTSVNIISFDAYGYAENLALYPDDLRKFLDRGGVLAWGLIPNTGEEAETITLEKVREVLEQALQLFERKGFDRQELLAKALFTPACGTGTLTVPVAERVMRLTRQLSDRVREEYNLR
ncbi:MAG: methionine synthase [Anaerolineae bacterium]|nr:methionine synthase [Anaerolineae bacterium]